MLALLFCATAIGCRHRVPAYTMPLGAQVPVELEEPAPDDEAATIATLPLPDLEPYLTTPPVPPAPRRRPASPKEEAQPPAQAPGEVPADLAIGNLSTGSDVTPQIQQQAQDMISSIFKRIATLSSRTANAQRRELDKVRNFLKQAQQALDTGDMDGAKNLATKARLLMDDLQQK
jgi:hypothetical protein